MKYTENPLESNFMFSFLENLDGKNKTMFFIGGLSFNYYSEVEQLLL